MEIQGIKRFIVPEHGTRPDADKEQGEENSSGVSGNFGGTEFADDNVERRTVMEVLSVIKVQFSLVHLKM